MRVTFHIGTEKTGTTSIQAALKSDRLRLADRGIMYPELFGSSNHMELVVGASAGDTYDELSMIELKRQNCGREEYRRRLCNRICEEMEARDFSRIIVSNEHCHSRLSNSSSIRRLVGLFPVTADDCEVIIYLRRQDRLAVSLYSTILKLGGSKTIFPSSKPEALPRYFDFARVIDDYIEVFGPKRVQVRLYEHKHLFEGDVVRDFYKAVELGIEPSVTPRENQSLSRAQASFLLKFNERFPFIKDGRMNEERGPIFEVIQLVGAGKPFQPDRKAAEAFYRTFRESNQNIRDRFFSELERETLFDEDFSEYPEVASTLALDEDSFFDFLSAIWRYKLSK